MTPRITCAKLFCIAVIGMSPCIQAESGDTAETQAVRTELLARIEKLEATQKDSVQKSSLRVDLLNTLSKLKMKGRFAAGLFDAGQDGAKAHDTFDVPEAKFQLVFQADEKNSIVMRMDLNNATFNKVDYLYLQSKDFLPFLKSTPFSLSGRLGRFKLGFGEETWSNNLVESVGPSNSAVNSGVSDEGLELAGSITLNPLGLKPLGWVLSVSDGNTGTGSDNSKEKAWFGKLHHTPFEPVYASFSYYASGDLGTASSELSFAGVATPPTGASNWTRRAWEAFLRYDFGKGKKALEPPAYSDSKAFIRLSLGHFSDEATGARDRDGNYGFLEGTYNLTSKWYAAARYSVVDLENDITASLNGITANRYQRYSLGAGYRWSENTLIKTGYDWNKESDRHVSGEPSDPSDNLFTLVLASQF
ncbi:MAG: hypothetical protein HY559_04115 [Gammaproteobacteria bacterium]|nr:hypothetical protein [Gammaproteobacteria bacterium]